MSRRDVVSILQCLLPTPLLEMRPHQPKKWWLSFKIILNLLFLQRLVAFCFFRLGGSKSRRVSFWNPAELFLKSIINTRNFSVLADKDNHCRSLHSLYLRMTSWEINQVIQSGKLKAMGITLPGSAGWVPCSKQRPWSRLAGLCSIHFRQPHFSLYVFHFFFPPLKEHPLPKKQEYQTLCC